MPAELLSTPSPSTLPRPSDRKQAPELQQQGLAAALSSEPFQQAGLGLADAAALEAELDAAWEAAQEAESQPAAVSAAGVGMTGQGVSFQTQPLQPAAGLAGAGSSSSAAPTGASSAEPKLPASTHNTSVTQPIQQSNGTAAPAEAPRQGSPPEASASTLSAVYSAVNGTVSSAAGSAASAVNSTVSSIAGSAASAVNSTVSAVVSSTMGAVNSSYTSLLTAASGSPVQSQQNQGLVANASAPGSSGQAAILANPTQQKLREAAASLLQEVQVSLHSWLGARAVTALARQFQAVSFACCTQASCEMQPAPNLTPTFWITCIAYLVLEHVLRSKLYARGTPLEKELWPSEAGHIRICQESVGSSSHPRAEPTESAHSRVLPNHAHPAAWQACNIAGIFLRGCSPCRRSWQMRLPPVSL